MNDGEKTGIINKLLPRYNELKRPGIANLDKIIIVLSATVPSPDLLLTDKLLISALKNKIKPIICINKVDESNEYANLLKEQYSVFDVIITSAKTCKGIDTLKDVIRDSCVCLAGQSAVGKSSIINLLRNEQSQEIGGLSKKTARGKHTTRMTELLPVPEINGIVCDTPGFSVLDSENIETDDIINGYPEFIPYLNECKFRSCRHLTEPDCGITNALSKGLINNERYSRYKYLLEEKIKSEVEKW